MRKTFKRLIRTDEEKALDHLELDLLLKKYNYMAIRHFLKQQDFTSVERIQQIVEYHKMTFERKKDWRNRLSPQGEFGTIMFIGINPSQKSRLKNIWDDPYGKYFGKMLREAGIDPDRVWMTNIYKKKTKDNRPLNEKEIREGVAELKYEIPYVGAKIVIALGRQPRAIMENFFKDCNWAGMYHPAYIIRNNSPDQRSKYLLELKKLKKYL